MFPFYLKRTLNTNSHNYIHYSSLRLMSFYWDLHSICMRRLFIVAFHYIQNSQVPPPAYYLISSVHFNQTLQFSFWWYCRKNLKLLHHLLNSNCLVVDYNLPAESQYSNVSWSLLEYLPPAFDHNQSYYLTFVLENFQSFLIHFLQWFRLPANKNWRCLPSEEELHNLQFLDQYHWLLHHELVCQPRRNLHLELRFRAAEFSPLQLIFFSETFDLNYRFPIHFILSGFFSAVIRF